MHISYAGSDTISEVATGKIVFSESYSEYVDIGRLIESQAGIELSKEDFIREQITARFFHPLARDTGSNIRFVLKEGSF